MTQQRFIRGYRRQGEGYAVRVEFTEAYTDGTSRFEEVFVPRDAFAGKTKAEKLQAVFDALEDAAADIAGEVVAAPAATKEILEQRAIAKYEQWQRWKTTRLEAQARGLGAAVVNALQAKEDASWSAYMTLLNEWRTAP